MSNERGVELRRLAPAILVLALACCEDGQLDADSGDGRHAIGSFVALTDYPIRVPITEEWTVIFSFFLEVDSPGSARLSEEEVEQLLVFLRQLVKKEHFAMHYSHKDSEFLEETRLAVNEILGRDLAKTVRFSNLVLEEMMYF